jgi:DNA-nicking Smr family endonuclease
MWLTAENNKKQPNGTIDLHGLYVKEALDEVEKAISNGQRVGLDELRIITGKGNHSANKQAKIKPAVAEMMRK